MGLIDYPARNRGAEAVDELTIGFAGTCYGMRRCSHGLPLEGLGIRYRRVRRLPWHRLPGAPEHWTHRYAFFPRPSVAAMHFFNGVCVSRVPWISSIEMEYPRYLGRVGRGARREAFESIDSDDCRMLLPLSDAARRFFLGRIDDPWRDSAEKKTVVFHGGVNIPEQALQARQAHLERADAPFTVGFVGKTFWRKGGPAVVEAIDQLRGRGADARLLVVSELNSNSYVKDPDELQVERMKRTVTETPWIEYHDRLPNHEVLSRMAACDVFAFPTFDESLGWVAIEAMGLGLPVVASNVFALPEIIGHEEQGLVIDLPLNDDRRWIGVDRLNPRQSYQEGHGMAVEGCIDAFELLISDPALRIRLGKAGRQRFEDRFSESVASSQLAGLLREKLV